MRIPTYTYHRILRFQDWLDINYPGENTLECSSWLFEEYQDYEHEQVFGLKPVEKEFQDKRPWFKKLEDKQGTPEYAVKCLSTWENNTMYTTPVHVDAGWWWSLERKEREEFNHDAMLRDEKIIPKSPSRFGSFNMKRDMSIFKREMREMKENIKSMKILGGK